MKTTCQICGREIKANTGLIAHHGYQRPYQAGYQTASCAGAKYLPYEKSCDRLKEYIPMLAGQIREIKKNLKRFIAEPPQTITRYSQYFESKTYTRPENFDPERYKGAAPAYSYESTYNSQRNEMESSIRYATMDLEIMEGRLQNWKPSK